MNACWPAPTARPESHQAQTPGSVTALTKLAAYEPDGSPAAELCWYLAREVRHRRHTWTTRHIDELRKNAAEGGDGAHLVLGAVPAPLLRPAPEKPSQLVSRVGWMSITERATSSHSVAAFG